MHLSWRIGLHIFQVMPPTSTYPPSFRWLCVKSFGIPKDFTRDSLAIFVPRTDSSTREVELELPKWKEGKFLAGHLEIPGAPGWVDADGDGTWWNWTEPILEVPRCSRGMIWYDMLPVFFCFDTFLETRANMLKSIGYGLWISIEMDMWRSRANYGSQTESILAIFMA